MASPVILTVTSGFGMGGDTFALAVLLAFMMQAQVTTLPRRRRSFHHRFGVRLYLLRHGPLLRYHRRAVRLSDRPYLRRDGGDDLAGIMALVNFESINARWPPTRIPDGGRRHGGNFRLTQRHRREIFGGRSGADLRHVDHADHFRPVRHFMAPVTHLSGWFGTPLNVSDINGLFGYIGMAMFMFVGCELVTPMAPEIKQAHRTIPRAMALGLLGSPAACLSTARRSTAGGEYRARRGQQRPSAGYTDGDPAFAERVMGHAGQYWLGLGCCWPAAPPSIR